MRTLLFTLLVGCAAEPAGEDPGEYYWAETKGGTGEDVHAWCDGTDIAVTGGVISAHWVVSSAPTYAPRGEDWRYGWLCRAGDTSAQAGACLDTRKGNRHVDQAEDPPQRN